MRTIAISLTLLTGLVGLTFLAGKHGSSPIGSDEAVRLPSATVETVTQAQEASLDSLEPVTGSDDQESDDTAPAIDLRDYALAFEEPNTSSEEYLEAFALNDENPLSFNAFRIQQTRLVQINTENIHRFVNQLLAEDPARLRFPLLPGVDCSLSDGSVMDSATGSYVIVTSACEETGKSRVSISYGAGTNKLVVDIQNSKHWVRLQRVTDNYGVVAEIDPQRQIPMEDGHN
ncbi:MAG: hypothetical protein AAGA68_12630 [Pseudomonadota bacterium]